MSRVLNVALHELAQAPLPAICAATASRDPDDDIAPRDVLLFKVEWGWFLSALVGGPLIFALLILFAPRRRARLPVCAAIAEQRNTIHRQGLLLTRLGYLAFAGVLLPWFGFEFPLLAVVVGGGWLCGLAGVYKLCRQSRELPALVELFAADRVALELPNWWVADEYRQALGYAPQGQPKSDQSQREEDALWETRPNPGGWDDAPAATENSAPVPPPTAPPAPPAPPPSPPPAPGTAADDWDARPRR